MALTTQVEEVLMKHIGGMLVPPSSLERFSQLSPFIEHKFKVEGRGWNDAAADIVLPGLGWVAVRQALLNTCADHVRHSPLWRSQVTGSGTCSLSVSVPSGVCVTMREPLLPGGAKQSMARFTGSKLSDRKGNTKRRQ